VTTLEDRLHAAARSIAQAVPEGSAPPLRLPARRSMISPVLRWLRTLLAPLGAATAVLGAVAVPLALPGLLQPASGATALGPEGTPPYYVVTTVAQTSGGTGVGQALVGSTASGKVLARVTPPRPYTQFGTVAGTAGDRAFVLTGLAGVSQIQAEGLFLLRFDPARESATLSALPIRAPSGVRFGPMAVSPDGSQVAVLATAGDRQRITVYSLATGANRSWGTMNLFPSSSLTFLTWSANGKQVEYGQRLGPAVFVGLLNPDLAGDSLPAETWLPFTLPDGPTALAISADGDVFASTPATTDTGDWRVTEYPVGTWHPHQLISVPGLADAPPAILWANASGGTLIVAPAVNRIGVISNGLYSSLPSAIMGEAFVRNSATWS
jgi:hypothetical protein